MNTIAFIGGTPAIKQNRARKQAIHDVFGGWCQQAWWQVLDIEDHEGFLISHLKAAVPQPREQVRGLIMTVNLPFEIPVQFREIADFVVDNWFCFRWRKT
jgi:hypothetical protein